MRIFGIDVSEWQGNFDFEAARAEGVRFAVIRGAYHTYIDSKFEQNYSRARRQGLDIGAYQYSKAVNAQQAAEEAEFLCERVLKGKRFELPIYIDIEDEVQRALGREEVTEIIKTWCDYMQNKNYFAGVYSSLSFFETHTNDEELRAYTHWVAQWERECTYTPRGVLGMWQFGGSVNEIRSTQVAGVTCDQDYMLMDFPEIIKRTGKNGYTAEEECRGEHGDRPGLVTYTVKRGDTLTEIADRFGTTVSRIIDDNKKEYPEITADYIRAGWHLKV